MSARPGLCGGYHVSGIPTAIQQFSVGVNASAHLDMLERNSKNCECTGSGTGPHTLGVRPWIRACRRYRRPHAVYCSGMGAEGS